MKIIAHAGCDEQYPPNTLTAFKRSAPYVDAIEMDLRRCGSGEIILFHDEKVGRKTGGDSYISDMDLDILKKEVIIESDERIPTLQEALETVPADIELNLELKETGLIPDIERITAEYENDLLISSFNNQTIEAVLERGWDVQVASLFETDPIPSAQEAAKLGCDAVHPHFKLCFDSEIVSKAQDLNLDVNVWTVGSKKNLHDLATIGVDGVIIDNWKIR